MKTTIERKFTCCQCGQVKEPAKDSCSTGYGTDKQGNKFCFDCIGENDRKELENAKPGERFTFYLVGSEITNWPGTFRAPIRNLTIGRHNLAGTRHDFYLTVGKNNFHGVQYGENTQLAHIKTLKP